MHWIFGAMLTVRLFVRNGPEKRNNPTARNIHSEVKQIDQVVENDCTSVIDGEQCAGRAGIRFQFQFRFRLWSL